jgi:hypothetical protein
MVPCLADCVDLRRDHFRGVHLFHIPRFGQFGRDETRERSLSLTGFAADPEIAAAELPRPREPFLTLIPNGKPLLRRPAKPLGPLTT